MDDFGIGLLILTTLLWLVIISLPTHLLIVEKYYKGLLIIIPITIIYIYHTYVILNGTHNPGCVTWHAVGTNARLVGDESYYGGRWRNNEHWEHDIDYVPEDCDCVTYHWFWGDENNFTQDSVIRGQFKGPSVKPNKLYVKEEELVSEDEEYFEDEFFKDGVYVKTTIKIE
jgi:hypothetical protein